MRTAAMVYAACPVDIREGTRSRRAPSASAPTGADRKELAKNFSRVLPHLTHCLPPWPISEHDEHIRAKGPKNAVPEP